MKALRVCLTRGLLGVVVAALAAGCSHTNEGKVAPVRSATPTTPMTYAPPAADILGLLDALNTAVASAAEIFDGRSGLGRRVPPPLERACEALQGAAQNEIGHGTTSEQAMVRQALEAGEFCLASLGQISGANPQRVVIPQVAARLEKARDSAAEAWRSVGTPPQR